MWIFTRYGFFSVVSTENGVTGEYDPFMVMVRARDEGHLDALIHRFKELLGKPPIIITLAADYKYRITVPKTKWAEVAKVMAEDIDYTNFKQAVADRPGMLTGRIYYRDSLHKVWNLVKSTLSH